MTLDQQPQDIRECVAVEAGLFADLQTGEVRSRTMDAHYNLLARQTLSHRRTKRRHTRFAKLTAASFCAAIAATAAMCYLGTARAQQAASESLAPIAAPIEAGTSDPQG